MVTVLPLLRYDLPHAVWASRIIIEKRPSTVALELPADFQGTLDSFLSGKISEKRFLALFGKMVGREIKIDRRVLGKKEPTEYKKSEEAAVYFVLAAKQVGAKVLAVDASFSSLRGEIERGLATGREARAVALDRAARALRKPDTGFLTFTEFVHAPFHFFELIVGHNPEEGPARHSPSCRICRFGVSWERFFHSVYSVSSNILSPLGEAKYVTALHAFDSLRERKIVDALSRLEHLSMKPKGRGKSGGTILIIHLWHAQAVETGLKKRRVPLSTI